jgi:hypothetical protein
MASRFRKVYIVCENNETFGQFTQKTVYKYKDHAEFQCQRAKAKALEEKDQYANVNKPMPKFRVHCFYLVHEDMFRD